MKDTIKYAIKDFLNGNRAVFAGLEVAVGESGSDR